jgi:tetratricopeptide (TPR) repeat protein
LRSHTLVRFTLIAVALLVVAWLALALRATRLEAEGRELLDSGETRPLTPADVEAGLDTLRRARQFNTDSDARLTQAALLAQQGRGREAIAVAERIVKDEPDNLEAWVLVYVSSAFTSDAPRAVQALRRVEGLNPQLADRLRARVPLRQ